MSDTSPRAEFAPSPRPQTRSSYGQLMLDLGQSKGSFHRYANADIKNTDWRLFRWLYLPVGRPICAGPTP